MQLKRFLSGIVMSLCLVALSVAYVGCNEAEKQINHIFIDTQQSILTVEQDSKLDDLVVVLYGMYPDATDVKIDLKDPKLTITGFDTSVAKDIKVTFSYKVSDALDPIEVETTITVTPKVKGITYKSGLDLVIEKDTQPDLSNLKITVNYVGGTSKDVVYDSKLMQVSVDTTTAGTNIPLTITYLGKQTTINVTINAVESISYVAGSLPDAYQFLPYNTSSAKITATYTDGTTKEITTANANLRVPSVDTTNYDPKTIKISYMGKETANITINVLALEDIDYVSGISSVVAQDSTISYNTLVLSGTYEGTETKTLNYANVKDFLTLTGVNTANVGEQTLTITLTNDSDELTTTCNITVATDNGIISKFSVPKFVADLTSEETNIHNTKNTKFSTYDSGVIGFAHVYGEENYQDYYVGSQNAWTFMPIVFSKGTQLKTIHTNVKVYKINDDKTETLLTDELSEYVTIDNLNYQTYDFTENANNKTFRIEVRPYGYETNPLYEDMFVTFTIKVIDAYNVYNTTDLRMFDNQNLENKWDAWDEEHGITQVVDTHGLVLQSDINITDEDIPAIHFWTAEQAAGFPDADKLVGSLWDRAGGAQGFIYNHRILDGSSYRFEGNYYQISAEQLALIVRENETKTIYPTGSDNYKNYITTHTNVFGFNGNENDKDGNKIAKYTINNVNFFGNSQRSEDPKYSGGVICFKSEYAQTTFNNVLSQRWFIAFFNNQGGCDNQKLSDNYSLTLNDVNGFDAYNTLIYNWGGKVNIKNSHLIGAGGPVMICDHVGNNKSTGEGGVISEVTTEDSVLESWVSGSEGWFVSYGASSQMGQIKAMVKLLSTYNKTIVKTINGQELLNMISVFKSGDVQGMSDSIIRGTFDVKNGENTINILDFAKKAKQYIPVASQAIQAITNCAETTANSIAETQVPYLSTDNGAFGMFTVDASNNFVLTELSTIRGEAYPSFTGVNQYSAFYLPNGMGATLGISDAE